MLAQWVGDSALIRSGGAAATPRATTQAERPGVSGARGTCEATLRSRPGPLPCRTPSAPALACRRPRALGLPALNTRLLRRGGVAAGAAPGSEAATGEPVAAPRETPRTCRACKQPFLPSLNDARACRSHPSIYSGAAAPPIARIHDLLYTPSPRRPCKWRTPSLRGL